MFQEPLVDRFSLELEATGRAIYDYAACGVCHGTNLESIGGSASDLRLRLSQDLETFEAVLGGALAPSMPAIEIGDAEAEERFMPIWPTPPSAPMRQPMSIRKGAAAGSSESAGKI